MFPFFLKFSLGFIILVWGMILPLKFEDNILKYSDLLCCSWEMSPHSFLAYGSYFSFLSGWLLNFFFPLRIFSFIQVYLAYISFLIHTVCLHCTSLSVDSSLSSLLENIHPLFSPYNTSSPLPLSFPLKLHLTLFYVIFLQLFHIQNFFDWCGILHVQLSIQ